MKSIITISRQCGSGGHTIGKLTAERLGVPFYDKEIIKAVAKRSGFSEEIIEQKGEYSTPSFLYNVATRGISAYNMSNRDTMPLAEQINAYQTEYIKELANNGPCVIVGRSADYILADRNDTFNVFVYGKLEDRMARIVSEHGVAENEARSHVLERDKKRSKYYKYVTDQVWGYAANYVLCINSSEVGIEKCVEIILSCCK